MSKKPQETGKPGAKGGKAVQAKIKLQIVAGKANPAPPIGPALGQHGVNIMEFCKAYNEQTKDKGNMVVPVEITVYGDRSFTFVLKTPPASVLILKAIGVDKGSARPNVNIVGTITDKQIEEIAHSKMSDLNAGDIEAAKKIIKGTAKSMGVKVQG
ncbi:MAG: 50S ribosomal protein L11 [Candidatus Margulisiibacteriota bacterium]